MKLGLSERKWAVIWATMSSSAVETSTIPEDISGQMLELDEDEDLEVFSKVNKTVDQCEAEEGQAAEGKPVWMKAGSEQEGSGDLFRRVSDTLAKL